MANTKITDLTASTAPLIADVVPMVDVANGTTKKVTMANLLKFITGLTAYTAPIGADLMFIYDTTAGAMKKITMQTFHYIFANQSVAAVSGAFSSDTYLVGSSIAIPSGAPYVGTTYRLVFDLTKTAAGTATPIITVRIGTAGTVADTARCTFTFGAGTAAVDTGIFEVICTFRTVGASTSAVLQGISRLTSNLTTTGISNAVKSVSVTSAGFDSTVASSIIGASYNGGASASHTIQLVRAELIL